MTQPGPQHDKLPQTPGSVDSSRASLLPENSLAVPAAQLVQLSFWQKPLVQNVLPLVTSLALHGAVLLLVVLSATAIDTVVRVVAREQIIIPEAEMVRDGPPGGIPHPGLGGDPMRDAAQDLIRDVPQDAAGISQRPGLTSLPEMLGGTGEIEGLATIGVGPGGLGSGTGTGSGQGAGGGPLAPFGVPGGGGGVGLKSDFIGSGGNARRIVYVCDASGSMMNVFDFLRVELNRSIERLLPIQSFNVIFFTDQEARALDRNRLLLAVPDNKRKAFEFVERTIGRGQTNPIPALELAFRQEPELVYLLTDGEFPDNEAVIRLCRQRTADGKTKINTLAFVARESLNRADTLSYVRTLQQIAKDSGGLFKMICPENVIVQ